MGDYIYRYCDPDTQRGSLLAQDTEHFFALQLFRIQLDDLRGNGDTLKRWPRDMGCRWHSASRIYIEISHGLRLFHPTNKYLVRVPQGDLDWSRHSARLSVRSAARDTKGV